MKKINIVLISLLTFMVFSCSKPPVEETILKYEQIIEGTFTDLSMKIQNLNLVKPILASDSLIILEKELETAKEKIISTQKDAVERAKEWCESTKGLSKSTSEKAQQDYEEAINELDKYNEGDFEGTFVAPIQNAVEKYKKLGETVLVNEYDCTYSIKNPLLNNVKQTISKKYFISTDDTKVVSTKSKE